MCDSCLSQLYAQHSFNFTLSDLLSFSCSSQLLALVLAPLHYFHSTLVRLSFLLPVWFGLYTSCRAISLSLAIMLFLGNWQFACLLFVFPLFLDVSTAQRTLKKVIAQLHLFFQECLHQLANMVHEETEKKAQSKSVRHWRAKVRESKNKDD